MFFIRSTLVLLLLVCCVKIAPPLPVIATSSSTDDQVFLVDVQVSPAADPDPRSDTAIAVSPIDEQIIVGASKVLVGGGTAGSGLSHIAYYFSSDGGRTWGSSVLGLETAQKNWGRAASPSLAVDLEGNFYLSVLMLDNSNFDTGVYVFKSGDGGRSFKDPVPVVLDIGNAANPKRAANPSITVDESSSSQFKNTIHVAWASQEPGRTVILTSHRRPGEATFSAPKTVSHGGDMRGPAVATGPGGELYLVWEGIGTPRVLLFNASTDGGETFLPSEAAPSIDLNIHNFTGSLSQPSPALSISGVPRMNSFPTMDVDRSAGPNRGMIYIAWAESVNRADSDIFIKKLTPPGGGRPTITGPLKVNNDQVGGDQFFPSLSVDATNGSVEAAFYDRRNNPGGVFVDMFIARSTDGGLSFPDNTQVSSERSDPRIQASVLAQPNGIQIGIGDYIGFTAARGKGHVLWADTRNGKQDIRYGQVPFESQGGGGGGGNPPANDSCLTPLVIEPFRSVFTGVNTREATSSPDDPVTCAGGAGSHTVWYRFTSSVDTVYRLNTITIDYDTVLSVYTGECGSLTRVACNDDFGPPTGLGSGSLLTFAARTGVIYLIEVSGKGSGGLLQVSLGGPAITNVEYTTAPDGSTALKITGAGFVDGNAEVKVRVGTDQSETILSKVIFDGQRQGDGTVTMIFATKKKLKKLIKKGRPVLIIVESPANVFGGNGLDSNPYSFTR